MAFCRIPSAFTSVGVLKRPYYGEPWVFGGWTAAEPPAS